MFSRTKKKKALKTYHTKILGLELQNDINYVKNKNVFKFLDNQLNGLIKHLSINVIHNLHF